MVLHSTLYSFIMWKIVFVFSLIAIANGEDGSAKLECALSADLEEEILSYSEVAKKIMYTSVYGAFKGRLYDTVAEFTDRFGPRQSGSTVLEQSIDYILNISASEKLNNVHGENVQVPRWIRGQESATLITPWKKNLKMLGLGSSVGTLPQGIEAEAVVVKSFQELETLPMSKVMGKIVVYNQDWVNYKKTVQYRLEGASRASARGAVATLIRSITSFSIDTPHAGQQDYSPNVTQIPAACITVEDSNMLHRMYKKGHRIVINLKMEAKTLSPTMSRNVVADLSGETDPHKVVIVSGHLDSWDVGQGVMDDAGGALLAWVSVVLLKHLNLTPRRTIRAVLFTAEEQGLFGANAYHDQHLNETDDFNFIMESDNGIFDTIGLTVAGNNEAACILQQVLNLFKALNATTINRAPTAGSDITVWSKHKIPMATLFDKSDKYFEFHHTGSDTLDWTNSEVLDKTTAIWAAVSYIIADLSVDMPRDL